MDQKNPSKMVLANGSGESRPSGMKFTSQDKGEDSRSNSSSRLKSFPVEKVRKLENPSSPIATHQPNFQQTGTYLPSLLTFGQDHKHGYGDAATCAQVPRQYPQQQIQQPQTMGSVSQQQVAYDQHQLIRMNPQSESALMNHSCDRQPHRPFVPNVPYGTTVWESSPQKTSQGSTPEDPRTSFQTFLTTSRTQPENVESPVVEFSSNDAGVSENRELEYEKQPVGGRNAEIHRKLVMQEKRRQTTMEEPQPQYPDISSKPFNTQSPPTRRENLYDDVQTNQRTPQLIYQQLQQNIAHQRQLQQHAANHHLQMMNGHVQAQNSAQTTQGNYYNYYTQPIPSNFPGMTSPQDVTMNHLKNSQQNIQRDVGYIGIPRNGRMYNNQAKQYLKPFAMDLTNQQIQNQLMFQQQSHSVQNQQCLNCRQNTAVQRQEYEQPTVQNKVKTHERTQRRNENKKVWQFTPVMIRDQELLVSTMRQQGTPYDVMRRQFNGLLNEQRKQLLYLEQHQRQENMEETQRPEMPVKKRIRMSDSDERPEWMAHITPSHVPYSEVEKQMAERERLLREEQRNGFKSQIETRSDVRLPGDTFCYNQPLQSSQLATPQSQQNVHQCSRMQAGDLQQGTPAVFSYVPSYFYDQSKKHAVDTMPNNVNNNPTLVPNSSLPRQVFQYQHPSCQPYSQQTVNSQLHQPQQYDTRAISQRPTKASDHMSLLKNVYQFYDRINNNDEPCSLLKLRLYKEVIRSQRRNNGLQDLETVQEALKALKDPESRKNLEYLANLDRKKGTVKLNGTQETNELPSELQLRPSMENSMQIQKGVSANGLENSRNSNNPVSQRLSSLRRSGQLVPIEYPQQRQVNRRSPYNMQAERENGMTAMCQQPMQQHYLNHEKIGIEPHSEGNPMTALNNAAHFKFPQYQLPYRQGTQNYYHNKQNLVYNDGQGDVNYVQRMDPLNVYNSNRAGGDANENLTSDQGQRLIQNKVAEGSNGICNPLNIEEARSIGGFTYFARKPDYMPGN